VTKDIKRQDKEEMKQDKNIRCDESSSNPATTAIKIKAAT
jgi:hypothetical protein